MNKKNEKVVFSTSEAASAALSAYERETESALIVVSHHILQRMNILKAVCSISGGGDSGSVDYPVFYDKDDNQVDVDDIKCESEEAERLFRVRQIYRPDWNQPVLALAAETILSRLLQGLGYDAVDLEYRGWGNGEVTCGGSVSFYFNEDTIHVVVEYTESSSCDRTGETEKIPITFDVSHLTDNGIWSVEFTDDRRFSEVYVSSSGDSLRVGEDDPFIDWAIDAVGKLDADEVVFSADLEEMELEFYTRNWEEELTHEGEHHYDLINGEFVPRDE